MKKASVFSLFLMILSIFVFTSCAKKPNYSGAFTQEEFVYSIGQEVDFYNHLTLNGVEKDEVILTLTGDIATRTDNIFKMTSSGRGLLTAKKDNQTIASARVVVKNQFTIPQKITLNENGVITWDETYAIFDGEVVKAGGYKIMVGEVEIPLITNSFILPAFGSYSVKVKALGNGYCDDSEYSLVQTFEYGVMARVSNVQLVGENYLSGGAMTLSWTGVENANYDVYVSGIRIATNITTTSVGVNFANLGGGRSVEVQIVANDSRIVAEENKYFSSSYTFSIVKPTDLDIEYITENGEGYIRWRDGVGAINYVVSYTDLNNSNNSGYLDSQTLFKKNGFVYSSLEGLNGGIYDLRVQAKGGNNLGNFSCDGNIASISQIAKLDKTSYTYSFENDSLILNIRNNSYSNTYAININGKVNNTKSENGLIYQTNLSELNYGENIVKVKNLPDLENEDYQVTIGNYTTNKVVSSDFVEYKIFKLKEISNLTHSLVSTDSKFLFDKVEDADAYKISLKGVVIEENFIETLDGKIEMRVKNLEDYNPVDNNYNFVITAYRKDGSACEVSINKTISILDKPVKAEQQENGFFIWNSLGEEGIEYRYTIYNADKEYNQGSIYAENVLTQECKTQKLPFGYYIIKVWGISTDTNQYLDGDFGDKIANNYLQSNFYVYEQIQTPELELNYDDLDDSYKLTIENVEHATTYEIFLDGESIAVISPPDLTKENFVYRFASRFESQDDNRKEFNIQVIARVNATGDSTLHPQSRASELKVIRLEKPTFNVSDDETLTVNKTEGVSSVEIRQAGGIVNENGSFEISLKDVAGLKQTSFIYRAIERQENIVYLDSAEKIYTFQRLDVSTNLSFNNGEISYQNASHSNVEKYCIKIVLVNSGLGNKEIVIEPINQLNFNLNDYLENMRDDEEFYSLYAQCEAIQVSVMAYRLGYIDNGGVFYLPSAYSTVLNLTKLDSPKVEFDIENLILSWNNVGEAGNTTYSIYVNGNKLAEGITANIYSLSSLDFSTAKQIVVFAENSAYLSSAGSEKIEIRKFDAISTFNLSNDTLKIMSKIPSIDLDEVEYIVINGEQKSPSQSGEIILDLNSSVVDYSIKLIGKRPYKEGGIIKYFISSDIRNFKFYDLSYFDSNLTNQDQIISWNSLGEEFKGQAGQPLSYKMVIKNSEGLDLQVLQGLRDNTISLTDPRLFDLEPNSYNLEILSELVSYSITADKDGAVGYFGQKNFGTLNITKEKQLPTDYTYYLESTNSSNPIDKRIKGDLKIRWENIWGNERPLFDIDVKTGDDSIDKKLTNIKAGDNIYVLIVKIASLQLVENNTFYEFTLTNYVVNQFFTAGVVNIPVIVHSGENIPSNTTNLSLRRLANVENLRLAPDGVLSYYSYMATNYVIELTMGGKTQYIQTNQTSINLWDNIDSFEGIKNFTGRYSIKVLADAESGAIPANMADEDKDKFQIDGYRMIGASQVYVENNGNIKIYITEADKQYILSGLTFDAIYQGVQKSFEPRYDDKEDVYIFSTNEFIELFEDEMKNASNGRLEFEIIVKNAECVNSAGKTFSFNYSLENENTLFAKREKMIVNGELKTQKDRDYLVVLGDVENTTGLWIELRYMREVIPETPEGEEAQPEYEEVIEKLAISGDDIRGYWIEKQDGSSYFSKILPSLTDAESCFALDVTEVLKNLGAGTYTFYISRIAKDANGEITQYGRAERVFYKLQEVNTNSIRLVDESLLWIGVDDKDATGYYINFYSRDNENYTLVNKVEINSATSYNLTEIIKTASSGNYITLTAISLTEGKLASKETPRYIVGRYETPSTLEVQEGVLQYAKESIANMELLNDISENYGSFNNLAEKIAGKVYKTPFNFTANNIDKIIVSLAFEDITQGGRTYYVTMKGVDLLASSFKNLDFESGSIRVTYYNALERIRDYFSNNAHAYAGQMVNLASSILNSSFGLAGSITLFDDHGEQVPSGNYKVSIRQEGSGFDEVNNEGMIPSNYSTSTSLQVLQTPNIQLHRTSSNNSNIYYLSFKPIDINGLPARHYVINLRFKNTVKEYSIRNIGEEEDNWQLYYEEGKSFALQTNIKDGYITINLSNDFARKVPDLDETPRDVAIYAVGDDYSLNSKTDTISMTILSFDYSSIKLKRGEMKWNATSGDQGTLVGFKHANSSPEIQAITTRSRTLNLSASGRYEYVIFMALGGISNNSVVVDSERYILQNVYKRYLPSVSVVNGGFAISNDIYEDRNIIDYLEFDISNNMSKLYKSLERTSTSNASLLEYLPGELEGEKDASIFYFKSIGNTISDDVKFQAIAKDEYNQDAGENIVNVDGDYILTLGDNDTRMILTSSILNVDAKMLPTIEDAIIDEDKIIWNINNQNLPELAEGYTIVYSVKVMAYQNQEEVSAFMNLGTFYTTSSLFPTKLVPFQENYPYYSISITTVGCSEVSQDNPNAIKTIDGKYIALSNSRYADDANSYALSSIERVYGNKHIVKLADIAEARIDEQGILIKYTGWISKSAINFKVVDRDGTEIKGEFFGKDESNVLKDDYYHYTEGEAKAEYSRIWFKPDEKGLSFEHGPYRFTIYAYKKDSQNWWTIPGNEDNVIASNEISLDQEIYKLRRVYKNDLVFTYNVDSNNYTLDFSRYFRNSEISYTSAYVKIQMSVAKTEENNLQVEITNENPILTIVKGEELAYNNGILILTGEESVSFKTIHNTSFSSPYTYIDSISDGSENIEFKLSSFGKDSSVEWDNENKIFKWNDTGFEPNNNYIIKLTYQDKSTEVSNIITVDKLELLNYQPQKMGTIEKVEVFVRSESFALFSSALEMTGEFKFNLFAGGEGTRENPYQISEGEQFKNIQLRNTSEQEYYFVLTQDIKIVIEQNDEQGFVINDAFYGNLDGRGHSILFEIRNSGDMTMISHYLPGSRNATETQCDFTKGVSLFKSVANSATIQNLNLNIDVELISIQEGTLIAPITQTNFGKITNINIISITSNLSLGDVSRVPVAFAGLVGDNYGTISECQNNASFELLVDAPRNNIPYLFYSGIALRNLKLGNNTGLIANCFSTGEIELTALKLSTIIWASGIVGTSTNSRIYNCGVDGNITIGRRGTISCTSYLAGVVLYSNNSNLQYCYNNARLNNSTTSQNVGGIAYIIEGGSAKGLVETSGLALVYRASSVTSENCYAVEGVDGLTSVTPIPLDIAAYNGYRLVVSQDLKASIIKNS